MCKYCRGGCRATAVRGLGGDDLSLGPPPPAPLQNGTVKSNAELVKLLNDAEVPGTDVVGEQAAARRPPPLPVGRRQLGAPSAPSTGVGGGFGWQGRWQY